MENLGGITYDTPITYHARTDYWGSNETLADERWHAIDIGQATIAIEDSWASEKGLPESNRFPWDHSKGLFTVKGIHDIHCLVRKPYIRNKYSALIFQLENDTPRTYQSRA